ncbi:MAG: propanediol utilization protein [Cypionkella sp.]
MIQIAGHFGELLQGRLGPDGPVVLVTLPCSALTVTAAATTAAQLTIHGAGQRLLTPARARDFLGHLGLTLRCRVILRATMPAGGGAGASTAALVALALLAGWQGAPETLAQACLAAEGATDPLMFAAPERLLWASRHAQRLADLPALPRFEVIGGFFGSLQRTDPADTRFADISDLIPQWTAAAGDLPRLADLASQSAVRNLALRGAQTSSLASLAADLGALGHVIAHTGAARGLIFARGQIPPQARTALIAAGGRQVVQFAAGGRA